MTEDRNFRYCYYEKVGFRGVEEKKSLDILLGEKPSDLLSKLSSFTLRFALPGMYRKLIWKLLLNVMSADSQNDSFVMNGQHLLCNDIIRALKIMLYIDDNTSYPKLLVLMFFLEFSELDNDINEQLQKNEVLDLLMIGDVLAKEFIIDKNNSKIEYCIEDTYWIFRNLISSVRSNFSALIETYEKFIHSLSQDDKSLHCHLVKTGVITAQPNTVNNNAKRDYKKYNLTPYRPIISWFVRFYAGIVDQQFLIRIFDRVVGAIIHGSRPFMVLTSVGKAILSHSRNELLDLNSNEEITKRLLSPLTIEQSEQVIIKALSP